MLEGINALFLIGGLLLFVSVMATRVSARLGFPLLLVFLGVGMLAGEEGIGGLRFDSLGGAFMVGQLALAVILLDGGLRTQWHTLRLSWRPSAVLATWGVVATVLPLGLFITWVLGVDWRLGLLMAAIVGSTDAAAVFSLLRNSGSTSLCFTLFFRKSGDTAHPPVRPAPSLPAFRSQSPALVHAR